MEGLMKTTNVLREEKWRSGQHVNLRPENGESIHLNGTFGHFIIMKNVSVSTRTGEGSILCRGRNFSPMFTSKLMPTQGTIGFISSTKRLQGKVTALVHLRVRDQKRAELSTRFYSSLGNA
jgi:ABC-type phosphate/phosphonate transport system ATPase subunit